jgi:hypothetical protein
VFLRGARESLSGGWRMMDDDGGWRRMEDGG